MNLPNINKLFDPNFLFIYVTKPLEHLIQMNDAFQSCQTLSSALTAY